MNYMICSMDDDGMIWDDPVLFGTLEECRQWANENDALGRTPPPYNWTVFRITPEYGWEGERMNPDDETDLTDDYESADCLEDQLDLLIADKEREELNQ